MFSFNPPSVSIGVKQITLDHAGDCAFVSHAHSDHALVARAPSIIASRETVDLMHARGYKVASDVQHGHYNAKLLNAGHVLGARQFYAETDEGTFAYTGDFRMSDSFCVKGADVPQCDTLFMEATFGSPEFVFPSRAETAEEISKWVLAEREKGIVVLGGYSLGKAQELIKILNDYTGITPVVEDTIARVNEVYRKYGVNLDYLLASSDEGLRELDKNFVAVVPMNKVNNNFAFQLSRAYSRRVASAVATGWAATERFANAKAFCLSDHSDYPELLQFVERSGAKKIVTHYGHAKRLARDLRAKGLNARALEDRQKLLIAWED